MKPNRLIGTAIALLACGIGSGCTSDDDGTLEQSWTIQDSTNPDACTVSGATQMRVIVVGSDGVSEATKFRSCAAFKTTQSLTADTYTGTATFLNANGVAVSQTKILPAFTIVEGVTTSRTINFVASDFLPR